MRMKEEEGKSESIYITASDRNSFEETVKLEFETGESRRMVTTIVLPSSPRGMKRGRA